MLYLIYLYLNINEESLFFSILSTCFIISKISFYNDVKFLKGVCIFKFLMNLSNEDIPQTVKHIS